MWENVLYYEWFFHFRDSARDNNILHLAATSISEHAAFAQALSKERLLYVADVILDATD
jgi:hypothetical protein